VSQATNHSEMNAKDTVLSSPDLFHFLMDFLPDFEPLRAMAVSKEWKHTMNNYKLPDLPIGLEYPKNLKFFSETSLAPSHVDLSYNQVFPLHRAHLIRKVKILTANSDRACIYTLPNIRELVFRAHIPITDLPSSVTKLTVGAGRATFYPGDFLLDGSNMIGLTSLDLYDVDIRSFKQAPIFPPNLTFLRMPSVCEKIPTPGTLPISLRKLVFGFVEGSILPGTLSPCLEHLEISSGFNTDIVKGVIPQNIEFINLGCDFRSNFRHSGECLRTIVINSHSTPSHWGRWLTRIIIDNLSSSEIDFLGMPPTLTELEFNASSRSPLITENLPYSLLSLTLHLAKDYSPLFYRRPPCLRTLNIEMAPGSILAPNDLPESITNLKMSSKTALNQDSALKFLPSNLRYFSIRSYSSGPFGSYIIYPFSIPFPPSLTVLDLPHYMNRFCKDILPNSLTQLTLPSTYSVYDLSESWFPASLDYIDCGQRKLGVPRRIG
jgi:hypothetical protein